ncbi:MAG: 3-hydroxyacyl-CoA dehydrogenase family protein [Actinobacteria bacterium]|nr:MAG: 3-hydroxyacyl-CoA dehydrogenase family protein [Actinomycetota bacterium]
MSTERIGVIGSGVMGSGIAQVLAVAGHAVLSYDVDSTALERARTTIATGRFGVGSAVDRGKLTRADAEAALARVTFTTKLDEALDVDVVIEAIPEKLGLKLAFWRDADRRAPEGAIFCSNSSGFPIEAMAAVVDRADKMIGWHWASPAPVMRLAEIVRGPATSDDTVATVVRMASAAGKNPVVVNDTTRAWGYVANRIYSAMIREALRVVDEGIASKQDVDQLMVDCFRWPSGPFGMTKGATSGWQ